MSVRIKKLTLWAFRSFVDRTTFEFPDTGLSLVNGTNLDTGGSSGAGKSSLVLAIAYAFGYSPFPATELQSWLTDDPMGVELTLDTPEGVIVLTRGSKTSIKVGAAKVITSATAVEKKLKELIGLDTELLEPLTYRKQNEPGVFLRRRNAEKLKFLTDVTGMSRFEDEVKKVAENVKGQTEELGRESARLDQAQKSLAQQVNSTPNVHYVDAEACKARAKECNDNISRLETELDGLHDQLATETRNENAFVETIRASYSNELKSLSRKVLDVQKAPFVEDRHELDELEEARGQLQSVWFELEKKDLVAREQFKSATNTIDKTIRVYRDQLATVPSLTRNRDSNQRDLDRLVAQDPTCPTCLRSWKGEALEAKIKKLQQELEEQNAALQTMELTRPVLVEKEAERASLVFTPNPLLEKYKEQYQELQRIRSGIEAKLQGKKQVFDLELKNQISTIRLDIEKRERERDEKIQAILKDPKSLKNELALKADQANQSHKLETVRLVSLNREVDASEKQNKEIGRLLTNFQASITQAKKSIDAQVENVDGLATALNAEKDYLELVKGWMAAFVEEILVSISDETNRILASVPNVAHCSLSFSTQSISEKGVVKNEISPLVMIGGHEAALRSGLSGGMLTAVDLAVDIAVAKIVCDRTGKFPGWMVLDEPFNGLGRTEKEASLKILEQYANDRLIFVIDHSSEFQQFFDQRIEINFKDGKTTKE